METYLLRQLVLELDELIEELHVDIFDALNTLIMDLLLKVFFGDVLAQFLGAKDALQPLALLQRRRVDKLLLCIGEGEDTVNEPL